MLDGPSGVWGELVDDLPHGFGQKKDADDERQPEDEQHVGVPRPCRGKRGELEGTRGHAASHLHRPLTLQPNAKMTISTVGLSKSRVEEALLGGRSMDVFSHWLWGVLITRKHVNWKVAGPMSVLPDLLAFVPSFVYSTMHGLERPTVDDTTVTSDFPAIAWDMYQYTHSAVVVTVGVLITWWLFTRFSGSRLESQFAQQHRSKPLMMAFLLWLPWYSNILLDIPTHTLQFFPTPVFYPLSDYGFDGTRWSNPIILVPNVLLLAGLWFYVKRKDRLAHRVA